jgi:cytochrome P450
MANAPLLVVAGSETTASALSGLFFYLSQTPRVKRILVEEIRSAFDDESEITMVSTNKLEYLHATLEETLRVYPPAAGTPPRASPGAEIEGKFVPKGVSHSNKALPHVLIVTIDGRSCHPMDNIPQP